MENRLFKITGNKVNSLLLTDNALRMSSRIFDSTDEFEEDWNKKFTLAATKLQIRYDSIRSITIEDNESKFLITYRTWAGFPFESEFSFIDADDYATFFEFLEQELYFVRKYETMSPFNAISRHLLGLFFALFLTACALYNAMEIARGVADASDDAKTRAYDAVIGFLGVKGVLAIGGGIACYIGYTIWKRWRNLPNRLKFVRQS